MTGEQGGMVRRFGRGWQAAFVWLAWIAMTCNALRFIVKYGSREMAQDDLWLVLPRIDPAGLSWEMLWALHNEHRNPLPCALQYGLYRLTGDMRSGNACTVAILAGIAFVMIALARRLRGRLTWTDALFPIVWLETGNVENLLMGYQMSLMLPTALASLVMMLIATSPRGLSPVHAAIAGASMLTLPTCGGPGFLQAPALCVWALATGFVMRKHGDVASRRAATILLTFAGATIALLGVYLLGIQSPPGLEHTFTVKAIGELCLVVLALGLGPAAESWWPWSGIAVAALATSALVVGARAWVKQSDERLRAFGLLCCLGANLCLVLGIGIGRSGTGGPYGFANRYVELTTPAICAAYVIWTLYGGAISRAVVRAATCVTVAAAFVCVNFRAGEAFGWERKNALDNLARDVANDLSASQIVQRNALAVDADTERLWYMYSNMARLRIEPFDRASERLVASFQFARTGAEVAHVQGPHVMVPSGAEGGEPALVLGRGALATYVVPEHARSVKIVYAFPADEDEESAGVSAQFVVVVSAEEFSSLLESESRKVLLVRALDPSSVEADRGEQTFEAELPAFRDRRLVLRFWVSRHDAQKQVRGRVVSVRFE
jgi:hypothetical protein